MPSIRRSSKKKHKNGDDDSVDSTISTSSTSSIKRLKNSIRFPSTLRKNKKSSRSKSVQVTAGVINTKGGKAAQAEAPNSPSKAARSYSEPVTGLAKVDSPKQNASSKKPTVTFSDKESSSGSENDKKNMDVKNVANVEGTETSEEPDAVAGPSSSIIGNKKNALSVVMLLMDTTTRRFEFVQFEFDARLATVTDMLQQIPESAGKELLQNMKYTGVCKIDGTELDLNTLIGDYCSAAIDAVGASLGVGGDDASLGGLKEQMKDHASSAIPHVFIAIPDTLNGKKTAEQATPIFADKTVIDMLRPTGISLSTVQENDDDDDDDDDDGIVPKKVERAIVTNENEDGTITPTLEVVSSESYSDETHKQIEAKEKSLQLPAESVEKDEIESLSQSSSSMLSYVLLGLRIISLAILIYGLWDAAGKDQIPSNEPILSTQAMEVAEETSVQAMEVAEETSVPNIKFGQRVGKVVDSMLKFRAEGKESVY